MKIVINRCYGGFGLSDEALALYNKLSGKSIIYVGDIERDDPNLIKVVEQLDNANDQYSALEVVEIPDEVEYEIEQYDGVEWVSEKHRTWS